MKKFFATVVNGFIILIFPLMVTVFLIGKLHHLITPIVNFIELKLHISRFLGVFNVFVISVVIMILLGWLAGLLIKSTWIRHLLENYEKNLLMKIPAYYKIKEFLNSEQGTNNYEQYHPALLSEGDGSFSLCCVTNESDNHYTVWITEGGFNGGEVKIVPKSSVEFFNISMIEYVKMMKEFGAKSAELMEQKNKGAFSKEIL